MQNAGFGTQQKKTALLCIDMQNDFVLPGAVLCVKEGINCVPFVINAVEVAHSSGIPVVWVIREHHRSGCDVEAFRKSLYTNGPGATVTGTTGAALVDGLSPNPEHDYVIVKKRFSAFMHTHLDALLRRLGVEHIVICGVQTPNCVRATAFDAVSLDYPRVTVLSDATASANSSVQASNLEDMKNVGIEILKVAEWKQQIS